MRRWKACSAWVWLWLRTARWIVTAASTACEGAANEAMIPSPVCLTSAPWCSASAARTMVLWTTRASNAAVSPRSWVSWVEPTMSVNSTVTMLLPVIRSPGVFQAAIASAIAANGAAAPSR